MTSIVQDDFKVKVDSEVIRQYPATGVYGILCEPGRPGLYDFNEIMESEKAKIRISINDLKDDPIISAYRSFYWRIGIDPTKQRPASEALIRRILQGGSIPSVNYIVDAGNIASVRTHIPIGLYDFDRLKGPLKLSMSKGGEAFRDITGKEWTTVEEVVLRDDVGVLHLFPHRDCERTKITSDSKRVLILGCRVLGVTEELCKAAAWQVVHVLDELRANPNDEMR
ncbi:MAG TPA: phenylalanine--tRNA ligase beta subunit-related protein [Conexivisphaerales archaeon]|nr:phenylalanine--tRNA ligase beta subunit-related protein [Conexivisphaerales archaeon]